MAYQALYRKYRPQTFSDVVGQEHITDTLKRELAEGKTVHAYLFTGTRGTGKTSCAKILAKAVNCLDLKDGDPCLKCESCLSCANEENTDIVEIDAASNNSVDNIRELREMVSFTPSNSKYRVYIIDEVHMLTISAFNALLKTLEEPPAHAIFILATTEVHKLPATILSRCQRFDFRRIDSERICERIQYIAEKEGLTVTDDAAMLIASAADGGMRDALSILDLCASSNKEIDVSFVESVCAMAGNDYLIKLADATHESNSEKALLLLDELHNSSVDMRRLLSELTLHFRDLMIVKTVKSEKKPIVCSKKKMDALEQQAAKFEIKEIIHCLDLLQGSFSSMQTGNPRCEMEMTLLKLCNPALSSDMASIEKRISTLEKRIIAGNVVAPKTATTPAPQPEITELPQDTAFPLEEEIPLPTDPPVENTIDAPIEKTENPTDPEVRRVDNWEEIVSIIKTECPLLAGVLNDSAAYIKGDYLLIDSKNAQFRSLINGGNPIYKNSIRKAALQVLGNTYKLGPYTKPNTKAASDPLTAFAEKLKQFEIN